MRRSAEFTGTVRSGRAAAAGSLVVHLDQSPAAGKLDPAAGRSPRVGFVVGRAVGDAVDRNRVRRRLRHLVRDRLDRLPAGARLVVRARPQAAELTSAQLAEQLDRALARVTGS